MLSDADDFDPDAVRTLTCLECGAPAVIRRDCHGLAHAAWKHEVGCCAPGYAVVQQKDSDGWTPVTWRREEGGAVVGTAYLKGHVVKWNRGEGEEVAERDSYTGYTRLTLRQKDGGVVSLVLAEYAQMSDFLIGCSVRRGRPSVVPTVADLLDAPQGEGPLLKRRRWRELFRLECHRL